MNSFQLDSKSDQNGRSRGSPRLQPWMVRTFAAGGIRVPPEGSARDRLGWFGYEMARFLDFSRKLPPGTGLRDAMAGYGRFLKSHEPPLPEWRIDQAREGLRLFRRGTEGWRLVPPKNGGDAGEKCSDHGQPRVDVAPNTGQSGQSG